MKKLFSIILAVSMMLSVCAVPALAEDTITITVDGKYVDCSVYGQLPVAIDGTTLVPLRSVFEALGAQVEWDGSTNSVVSFKDDTSILLVLNSTQMIVNGEAKTLSVPAQSMNDRIMVPVRAIAEAFGCDVRWDGDTYTVVVTTTVAEDSPEDVVRKAYDAAFALDFETVAKYYKDSSKVDIGLTDIVDALAASGEMTTEQATMVAEFTTALMSLCKYEIEDVVVSDDTAVATVTLTSPDFNTLNVDDYVTEEVLEKLLEETLAEFGYTMYDLDFISFSNPDEVYIIQNAFIEKVWDYAVEVVVKEAKNLPVIEETVMINLEKIDGKWLIVNMG